MPEFTGDTLMAWVHSEDVKHSWAISWVNCLMTERRLSPRWIAMECGTDGLVAARNQTVVAFLESPDEWLFWVDTDMGFKPDTVSRLLEHADPATAPVVGALCFANKKIAGDGFNGSRFGPVPMLFSWVELATGENGYMPILDYPRDSLVPVAATGSACIVIHRSVFEKVAAKFGPTWYAKLTNPTTGQVIGEDLSFCYRASQVGIPLHVNTAVKTTHLKPIYLQEADYRHPADAEGVPA